LDIAHAHNLIYIDTFQTSTVFAHHYPEAVADDNFHPSDFGYALWASTIAAAIQDKLTLLKVGGYNPAAN
jgi:lysophospholipase L1-like esterase